jgi:hypothetical protein
MRKRTLIIDAGDSRVQQREQAVTKTHRVETVRQPLAGAERRVGAGECHALPVKRDPEIRHARDPPATDRMARCERRDQWRYYMDRPRGPRPPSDQLRLFVVSALENVHGARRGHRRPRSPKAHAQTCKCGSPLRWEAPKNKAIGRRLALRLSPDCGIVTAMSRDNAEDALRFCLIGDRASSRHVPPWVRFLSRAMTSGFICRISDRDCPDCESHITFAVDLPPTIPRLGDGVRARICVACGGVRIEYWHMGMRSEIGSGGDDWVRLEGPVVGLKAALTERLEGRYPGGSRC